MEQHVQRIAIAITLGIILFGGVVVYVQTRTPRPATAPDLALMARVTPAQVAEQYQINLRVVVGKLLPMLDRQVLVSDRPAFGALRDELVVLSVPLQAQASHLQLVLKLSLLHELLSPGTVTAAARGVPTVAGTQAELKALLVSNSALVQ